MSGDIFQRLAAPFPAHLVSWRVGSTTGDKSKGMALAFIDARDVMERLDDVCSPAGWQCRYPHANGKTVCEIGLKVGDEWIWKADGAGDTDVEKEKGALSDAFKRAAVRWGIGRYLYHLPSPWVDLEAKGRTHVFTEASRKKLEALLVRDAAATAPKPAQTDTRIAPATGAAPISLIERSKVLEGTMRAAKTPDELRKAWDRGEQLRGMLDDKEPERFVELTDLYKVLFDKLADLVSA